MQQLGLVAAVIFATAILIPVSTRINLPWPVLVTVFGLLLAAIPQIPQVHVEPELILPLVLPPLLFAAARKTSWRLWVANARPILLLAVALVVVTTAVVAAVASAVVPGISLAGAVALGALVSPPDPVAATAIASKLHLPKRLVSMLEGEGLFNDVAALVLYQVAIAAVVGGSFSPGEAALKLLLAAVLALVVGFAFGWGVSRLIALLGTGDPRPQVLLSILAPTATYVAAEEMHGSGVLAVLVYTLYSVSRPVDAADAQGRLTTDVFWSMTETLVTGIAFGLVGLEFQTALTEVGERWTTLVGETAAVVAAVVAVRLLYLLPSVLLTKSLYRRLQVGALDDALSGQRSSRRLRRQRDTDVPIGWRETVVVWWAGMRGVATVALALAIPTTTDAGAPFPARERILFIAFAVVLVTLVLQGVTLPTLVKALGVRAGNSDGDEAEAVLIERAAHAAAEALNHLQDDVDFGVEVWDRLNAFPTDLLSRLSPQLASNTDHAAAEQRGLDREQFVLGLRQMLSAAREELLNARSERGVEPEMVDHLVRRLDLYSLPTTPR
ncbi:Na+/H+ antiporter [Jatrophihabitans lederbergiae]|uniref:Na+/H+ antiporter n=1 Tax=Jatrophihabitans lederbergiae TaxID=3075547 RepID=A0ABU2JDC2_9ACTN|nr:Na+/H+ antiporter [Jatrophihabitans sp. DSM 44399]MDT0262975.1 Na+/H+ antiporter [Jatrophihabitans sp. DSM 44399]